MPLLNSFKRNLLEGILKYREIIESPKNTLKIKEKFNYTIDEMKIQILPYFRQLLDKKIIKPTFDTINLQNLRD